MKLKRSSGILLHPSALPGPEGIGTIGKPAHDFITWLHDAGQSLWQILPIGPTGYGDSPYASFSTFAGNPLLIDLEMLKNQNLLSSEDLILPDYLTSKNLIDYGSVHWWKIPLLNKAAEAFIATTNNPDWTQEHSKYKQFVRTNAYWLDDYSVFMDIKNYYDADASEKGLTGKNWGNYWPEGLKKHLPMAVRSWETAHAESIEIQRVTQFFFFTQWQQLKKYASSLGITIIGDLPIFVAYDSSDVWSNRQLFLLDKNCLSTSVAGVPPDYFSETGQLWGNPLYNWKKMKRSGYSWWISRIRHMLTLVDYIRIDHFRGFDSFWAIPAAEATAVNGKWVKAPGFDFFRKLAHCVPDTPILAEDLGVITEEVRELRDFFNLPGMKVLQFAFNPDEMSGILENSFLPHMYQPNCVVYTGTHDNDTMTGWIDKASKEELEMIQTYTGKDQLPKTGMTKELIRLALSSTAAFAIFPLQDIYELGSEARINTPSTTGKNWSWRMEGTLLDTKRQQWLKMLSALYGRNSSQLVQ